MNTLCPDAGVSVDPNMPPPSDKQVLYQLLIMPSLVSFECMFFSLLIGSVFASDSTCWLR